MFAYTGYEWVYVGPFQLMTHVNFHYSKICKYKRKLNSWGRALLQDLIAVELVRGIMEIHLIFLTYIVISSHTLYARVKKVPVM